MYVFLPFIEVRLISCVSDLDKASVDRSSVWSVPAMLPKASDAGMLIHFSTAPIKSYLVIQLLLSAYKLNVSYPTPFPSLKLSVLVAIRQELSSIV